MVKTMDSGSGDNSSFDELTSDFSILSHPVDESSSIVQLPNGNNLEHLQNLHFTPPEETQSGGNSMVIHEHLEQILKENTELKEALQQNNSTLRQHFQTLLSWQEQQGKMRSRHKQVLEDVQQSTVSLQRDKDQLANKVDELESELKKFKAEYEKALKENNESTEELRNEIERQKVFQLQLQQNVNELLFENELLKNEKIKLEKDLKFKSDEKIERQSSPLVVMEEDLGYAVVHHSGATRTEKEYEIERLDSTVCALQEGKILLMKLLEEKDTELRYLKSKLDDAQSVIDKLQKSPIPSIVSPPPLDPQWTLMEAGLMSTNKDLEAASVYLQKYETRFSSVDQQLSEFQKHLQTNMDKNDDLQRHEELRGEINLLQALLKSEQEANSSDKLNLEEAKLKFDALHREYKSLLQQWHDYQSEVKTKGRQIDYMSEIEKRQHQEQLDEVTAKVMTMEESLLDKDREIIKTKKQVDILKRENEQVPILRAQVEVYQQELRTFKENTKQHDSLMESKRNEIHSLQAQVVQLMDEINHHSQSQLMEISQQARLSQNEGAVGSAEGIRSQPHSRQTNAESRVFFETAVTEPPVDEDTCVCECPKCNMKFVGLQAVHNHMHSCIFGPESTSFL